MKHVVMLVILVSVLVAGCAPVNPEFGVRLDEDEAAALMEQRVVQDYHYRAYGGHDLLLVGVSRPPEDRCRGLWRDYFGDEPSYATCFEGVFRFEVNASAPGVVDHYTARVFLLGTETKGFEISEEPVPLVGSFAECVDAGFELLEPDCAGCVRSCVTPSGEEFVEGDSDA
ncbi:hypothetical protein KY327_01985 [Candidatus Woesearchaeota archaeon]|nr:hypothetical protein [Candidatus Woesearchaeota archaeon]